MKTIRLTLLICAILLAGCAAQEDIFVLDSRILLLEKSNADLQTESVALLKRIEELQAQSAKISRRMDAYGKERQTEDQNLRGQAAGLRASLEELQEDVRALNGRLEETVFLVNRKTEAIDTRSGQIEKQFTRINKTEQKSRTRIARLEEYLNFESGQSDLQTKPVLDAKPAAPDTDETLSEKEVYQTAKAAFDEGNLELAGQGFEKFLKQFPKSEQADNAQFWIGEIHYREKWYEKAILEYQKVIENYPTGNKVRASLLKQGLAFYNLGDEANARLILKELINKYPKSNEAEIAAKKIKGFSS